MTPATHIAVPASSACPSGRTTLAQPIARTYLMPLSAAQAALVAAGHVTLPTMAYFNSAAFKALVPTSAASCFRSCNAGAYADMLSASAACSKCPLGKYNAYSGRLYGAKNVHYGCSAWTCKPGLVLRGLVSVAAAARAAAARAAADRAAAACADALALSPLPGTDLPAVLAGPAHHARRRQSLHRLPHRPLQVKNT